ncbi:MAG: RAMP superfamily CRISPR-associated protein [Methanosarcina sp.]|uniref:RAMP superfamily CRISPR-associated protein n=1 Tax=Methanosarcina sp. TaxID=2213 RepID=UPI0026056B8E|nr:RAMP superfamily CRISPR-associated protein [Methanosarcina sp.]MDD3248466.1 RAMP superfamily CRISPR-associated protein [Methanosarcina sp.]MDD4248482.1 RAMP superfamily CRISPR-associated protein [Methanosarcina sp.]
MAWTFYRISLRLLSPVHIGWKKTDNLQQTRPYVLAKTMWGALTARIARDYGNFDYEKIGNEVAENLRFSYFYPTIIPNKIDIFPWENIDDFSWKYLNSSQNTALNQKTAEEGSLHETEYISPKTRNNKSVYLLGYLFEKEGSDLKWQESLKKVQLGGERGYGWGKVEMGKVEIEEISKLHDEFFNGYTVDLSNENPIINVLEENKYVLAHTLANNLNLNGLIEPFVGRETSKNKYFGGKYSNAEICWMPGGFVNKNEKFEVLPTGLWKSMH